MKNIRITDLEMSILKVFKSIKELKGENFQISIDEDEYWNIDDNEIYDIDSKPNDLDIGSLYSDLEVIEKILNNQLEPVPYNLKLFSCMLRYISNKV